MFIVPSIKCTSTIPIIMIKKDPQNEKRLHNYLKTNYYRCKARKVIKNEEREKILHAINKFLTSNETDTPILTYVPFPVV